MNGELVLDEALERGVFIVPRAYSFAVLAAISLVYRTRYEVFARDFSGEACSRPKAWFS